MLLSELVFATNNRHKLEEVKACLGDSFKILSLADVGCNEDIPETADTFQGNALLKARYIYNNYHVNCFADDTGLEVDALDGEPGVHSARYAGDHDSEANMTKLLQKLEKKCDRNAQFRTVIALIIDGKETLFQGIVRGSISKERSGTGGFGYDPIFVPQGYTQSFSELSMEEKNSISHRGRAVRQLVEYLKSQYEK